MVRVWLNPLPTPPNMHVLVYACMHWHCLLCNKNISVADDPSGETVLGHLLAIHPLDTYPPPITTWTFTPLACLPPCYLPPENLPTWLFTRCTFLTLHSIYSLDIHLGCLPLVPFTYTSMPFTPWIYAHLLIVKFGLAYVYSECIMKVTSKCECIMICSSRSF